MIQKSNFEIKDEDLAIVTLSGKLDTLSSHIFQKQMEIILEKNIKKIAIHAEELEYFSSAGLRIIAYTKQKMGKNSSVYLISPQPMVLNVFKSTGFDRFITILDTIGEIENFEQNKVA